MYIYVLDYCRGKLTVEKVEDGIDYEDYVSDNYGLDNVSWMVSEELDIEIKTN